MPRVYLVRHAQSAANAGAQTSGQATIPLTATGARQARELAARFTERPALIVVSRYLRAAQTAAPLIERYPGVPVEVWPVEEFTYLDAAVCAGTTYAERESLRDAYWRRCDPHWRDAPECESFHAFLARVRAFEESLRRRAEEPVVVFTHGHFLQAVLWLQQDPIGDMSGFARFQREAPIPNCGVLARTAQSSLYITMPESSFG